MRVDVMSSPRDKLDKNLIKKVENFKEIFV